MGIGVLVWFRWGGDGRGGQWMLGGGRGGGRYMLEGGGRGGVGGICWRGGEEGREDKMSLGPLGFVDMCGASGKGGGVRLYRWVYK